MTGPEDEATGGDRSRAGHADREQAIEQLKTAFVDGRLTKAEFDTRAGRALSARTYADLAVLTADIPADPVDPADPPTTVAARPSHRPRRRPLVRAAAGSSACLVVATAAARIASRLDPGATPTPYDSYAKYFFLIAVLAVFTAVGILAVGVSNSVALRRSGRQLPPPGSGGEAVEDEPPGGTGDHRKRPGRDGDGNRADLRAVRLREWAWRVSAGTGAGRGAGGVGPAPWAV